MTDVCLPPRAIVNDCWRNTCPFCESPELVNLGGFSYASPILFSTTLIATARKSELWGCRRCQSRFVQNCLSEKDAVELYSTGQSGDRWQPIQFVDYHCREVVQAVRQALEGGGFVVDVGSNTGEFLDFARAVGCKTGGVEFSQSSREILKAKRHLAYSDLDEVKDESVDVITAFDLIEHLHHPAQFMSDCQKKLRPGGQLIIFTGNALSLGARIAGANWWYLGYPEHIVFPSEKYFGEHTPFRLRQTIATYACKTAKSTPYRIVRALLGGGLQRNYRGAPAIGPDHMLLVMQK